MVTKLGWQKYRWKIQKPSYKIKKQGLSKSVKKGKFVAKNPFSNNVEWNSKNFWKMISADVKSKLKQQ